MLENGRLYQGIKYTHGIRIVREWLRDHNYGYTITQVNDTIGNGTKIMRLTIGRMMSTLIKKGLVHERKIKQVTLYYAIVTKPKIVARIMKRMIEADRFINENNNKL